MKPRANIPRLTALPGLIALTGTLHAADDIHWDTGATPGIQGGAGNWNISADTNWTTDDGATRVAWDNVNWFDDTAIFSDTGGTVTLGEAIQLAGIRLSGNINGYNLTGSSIGFGSQPGSIDSTSLGTSGGSVFTINSPLTGSGGITIAASGNLSASGGSSGTRLDLLGDNTGLTGGIAITAGLVRAGSQASLGSNSISLTNGGGLVATSDISLSNAVAFSTGGGTLRAYGSRTLTLTGAITGSATLTKTDGGTLNLSPGANSTFSGAFVIAAGSVTIGSNYQATGTGALTLDSGTTLNSYSANASFTTTYANSAISVDGGTWNFGGSSPGNVTHTYNFTGGDLGNASATDPATAIQIHNGTLNLSSSNTTTKNFNGRINWSGDNTINRTSSNFTHNTNWNRAWYGTGTVTVNFTGGASGRAMTFAGSGSTYSGTVILNNTQASGGNDPAFNLNAAIGSAAFEVRNRWNLVNNSSGALDNSTGITVRDAASRLTLTQPVTNTGLNLTIQNGNVYLGDAASTIGNLSGTGGAIRATATSSALTVTQTTSGSYDGVLDDNSNTLAFTKAGAATLTLTGANTYTGATTINNGILQVTGGLGNTAVSVKSGATFDVSGTVGGSVTVESNATLKGSGGLFNASVTIDGIHAPGSSPGLQTFAAGLSYGNGSVFNLELVGDTLGIRGTDFDGVDVTGGNLTINPGATLMLLVSGIDYSTSVWDSDRSFTIIDYTAGGTSTGAFSLNTSGAGSFASQGSWSLANSNDDVVLTWTAVPEPHAALLGGLGLLALLRRRR